MIQFKMRKYYSILPSVNFKRVQQQNNTIGWVIIYFDGIKQEHMKWSRANIWKRSDHLHSLCVFQLINLEGGSQLKFLLKDCGEWHAPVHDATSKLSNVVSLNIYSEFKYQQQQQKVHILLTAPWITLHISDYQKKSQIVPRV